MSSLFFFSESPVVILKLQIKVGFGIIAPWTPEPFFHLFIHLCIQETLTRCLLEKQSSSSNRQTVARFPKTVLLGGETQIGQ